MNTAENIDHSVVATLRKRYTLALSIIACIIIFSQLLIQVQIGKEADDSRIINIAGRQRMLSQKITKCALAAYISQNDVERKRYLAELTSATQLWQLSHDGLQNGNRALGLPGKNSPTIQQMFEGVQDHFDAMQSASKLLLGELSKPMSAQNPLILQGYLNQLLGSEGEFLKGMDTIVFEYDAEAKDKIILTKYLELLLMVCALFVLMMEALFIFIPAERSIRTALSTLVDNENNVRKLFDVAPSPLILVDPKDFSILRLNYLATQLLKTPFSDALHHKLYDFISSDYLKSLEVSEQMLYGGQLDTAEVVLRNLSGEAFYMQMTGARFGYYGQSVFLIGLSDISERKKNEEVLNKLATVDEMTGLFNRRTGLLIVEKEMEHAKREVQDLTLCFIDLDGLKMVNDQFGHHEGDWFIRTIAKILLGSIRAGDTVFRFGGDEIVMVLVNCKEEDARIIMDRIDLDISKSNLHSNKPFKIGMSYGLADFAKLKPATVEAFTSLADSIMYEQKKAKKATRR